MQPLLACENKIITYSEFTSVTLVIQHLKRMRRVTLPSMVCLAVPYYSTLSHKRQDFQENKCEHKMYVCVLRSSL